jgi:hypothetical protein
MKTIFQFFILCYCAVFLGCSINSNESSISSGGNQTTTNNHDSLVTPHDTTLDSQLTPISAIETAYTNHDSDISITVKGSLTRILSDDTIGDKHQRFIISLSNGQTLLIAHNIDIGSRVAGIAIGSTIYAHGDYIWNDQGGLVHWTHRDPLGKHENGWIVFNNEKYE